MRPPDKRVNVQVNVKFCGTAGTLPLTLSWSRVELSVDFMSESPPLPGGGKGNGYRSAPNS